MPLKSKFSDEYKRRAIAAFRNRGNRSADAVARQFSVTAATIYYWMKGDRAVVNPRDRYPLDFKRKAVAALINRGDQSTDEVAEALGVARSQLYRWKDQLGNGSANEEPNERTGYAGQRRRLPLSVAPAVADPPDDSDEAIPDRKLSATQAAAERRQLTALRAERERLSAEAAALRKTIVLLGRGH